MAEVMEEASYVRHHKKKIAFIFSAMRHFAEELREAGWTVDYVNLNDPNNSGAFRGEVERAVKRLTPKKLVVTAPGEWRIRHETQSWGRVLGLPVEILEDDRFICSHEEFHAWAHGRKQLRMEFFYREMRRKTGLLMDGYKPIGGKWNFDADNRKPAKGNLRMPSPYQVSPDALTGDVLALVGERFTDHFGDLTPFWFGVTRADAERASRAFFGSRIARVWRLSRCDGFR